MSDVPKKKVIVLTNVSKTFKEGEVPTVKGVTLDVEEGELLVLLGGSGSGKSTTLKMINRLHKPDKGSTIQVWIKKKVGAKGQEEEVWQDIYPKPQDDPVPLRRQIGYVIQNNGLFPHMSIRDNIAVVPKLLKWPREEIEERVQELLRLIRLGPEHADKYPNELSGGMNQRVGFARALAARQPVMLLDEPFGALDPVTRKEVCDFFRDIQKQLRITAVMVTHDIMEALELGDRIAVMQKVTPEGGGLVGWGTKEQLLHESKDPYVIQLLKGKLEIDKERAETYLRPALTASSPCPSVEGDQTMTPENLGSASRGGKS